LYADEIGNLGHTFNLMTNELEKAYHEIKEYALKAAVAQHKEQKIRNIFQKYVPKDVIEQFFSNPERMLVGEDRMIAILFSDIREFTSFSEKMLPNEVVESLNTYFTIMVEVITNHHGIVDKYIGDAIMAFYGAPAQHENDADEAVLSALEMINALTDFNDWQKQRNRLPFNIGIGINYGTVTVGNIGSDKKMDYTIIGDMVNLASRIEGLTKYYKESVLISEYLYKKLQQDFPSRLVDRVMVKGKTQSVNIYSVRKKLTSTEADAWPLHQQALNHYYARNFKGALAHFTKVHTILPNDYISHLFMKRCTNYLENPPDAQWDGVIQLDSK
jgi:class 3 adenylate cyclase